MSSDNFIKNITSKDINLSKNTISQMLNNASIEDFQKLCSSCDFIFPFVKERIVEALAKLDVSRDKRALMILKNSLMDNSIHLRIASIETLSNSDFNCAYNLIYERLKNDDNDEVRKNALIALYNMSDRKILDEVLMEDDSYDWELNPPILVPIRREEGAGGNGKGLL